MGNFILTFVVCAVVSFAAGLLLASCDTDLYLDDEEIDEEIRYLEDLKRRKRRSRRREGDKHGKR